MSETDIFFTYECYNKIPSKHIYFKEMINNFIKTVMECVILCTKVENIIRKNYNPLFIFDEIANGITCVTTYFIPSFRYSKIKSTVYEWIKKHT